VDIRVVGLFALAQAPWAFKFLWSPFVDRFPLPFLGRKRGWILLNQAVLFGLALCFARGGGIGWIALLSLATAFASATQDIAIDAYTVEVLRPEEHGIASGAANAARRTALLVSAGVSVTAAGTFGWPAVQVALGVLYLPLMVMTVLAPEPEAPPEPAKTLRDAVWEPFVGFLSKDRALEILAFVILYKLSDQLAQALITPFLVQVGFSDADIGVNKGLIGTWAIVLGTFLGGLGAMRLGLGRALWVFGVIQSTAHLGYALLAQTGPVRPLLFTAHAFEFLTTGLGNGAFQILLWRLTEKRFSATQYALFSSMFAIPRVLAGPITGLLVDALGWRNFFVITVFTGIPGLVMLQRFAPFWEREPILRESAPRRREPIGIRGLLARAAGMGALTWAGGVLILGTLGAFKAARGGAVFELRGALATLLAPRDVAGWTSWGGLLLTALTVGFGTAAALAVSRRTRGGGEEADPDSRTIEEGTPERGPVS
jgi:PAT family beta-lactamase induction signal transducer AmpG